MIGNTGRSGKVSHRQGPREVPYGQQQEMCQVAPSNAVPSGVVGIEGGVISGVQQPKSRRWGAGGDHAMTNDSTKSSLLAARKRHDGPPFSTIGSIRSKPACAIGCAALSRR